MKDSDWEFIRHLYLTPNLTKVANDMFMTQPALTKKLQSIENELNIQIVLRSKTGLEFTPEGAYLAKQAIQYHSFMEQTRQHLDILRSNHRASISIASSISFLKYQLPEIISEYQKIFPDTHFNIIGGRSSEVQSMVAKGTVDFAIIRSTPDEGLVKIMVNQETAYLLSVGPISFADLPHIPRIDYPINSTCTKLISEWWQDSFNEPPTIGMTVEHLDQTWPMVEHGLGYSICFLPNCDKIHALKNIYMTPLIGKDGFPISRPTWIVYHEKTVLLPHQKSFISFIQSWALPD